MPFTGKILKFCRTNTGAIAAGILILSAACAFGAGSDATSFPPTAGAYSDKPGASTLEVLIGRAKAEPFNIIATALFFAAIVHTFLAPMFQRLSHRYEKQHQERLSKSDSPKDQVSFKAELFHFLGEVEAVFGIWVLPLLVLLSFYKGWPAAREYVGHRLNFVEPLFVVVIMTIASSRPILKLAEQIMALGAKLGGSTPGSWWFSVLTIGPLLGSFITEPAAMTICALLLAGKFYRYKPSQSLAYATLGLLFVNISVGGTLTHFAAPPVLMVAGKWGWGFSHMLTHFGWKAFLGILGANILYTLWFRQELAGMANPKARDEHAEQTAIPVWITLSHVLFLAWTVFNNHYPALFIGGFLFYLAFLQATEHHQTSVSLRPPLLVGFFLAGLVVHGGLQGWWIGPVLSSLDSTPLFFSAILLTAFNDNAAITYLASLVPDFGPTLQYSVVAGAVAGGGLTVIANAPNPAGQSILSRFFPDGVSAAKLFMGAAVPTAVVTACFLIFRGA